MNTLKQMNTMNERFDALWKELKLKDETTFESIPADVQFKLFIESEIELAKQEVYSDNGANDMCEYWYQKGKKEILEMVKKEIEGILESAENLGIMKKETQSHQYIHLCCHLRSLKQKLLAKE